MSTTTNWQTGCESGACVRVKRLRDADVVVIGNTDQTAPAYFTYDEWLNFVAAVKAGKFDDVED